MSTPGFQPFAKPRRTWALAMGMALATTAAVTPPRAGGGQGQPPAAPPPTTTPVAPPPPPPTAALPGPKAVALAFAGSIEKGDAATARGLVPGDEAHARWVEAAAALSVALKKLDAAAAARFGDAGKAVSRNQLHLTDAAKSLEQAQEKVDGDSATLTVPGRAEPLVLKKVEGKWQLQVGPAAAGEAESQLALYARLTRAAQRTAEELAAGTYATAEQAAKVFAARVLDARMGR
jgi:hypothetical protein